MLLARTCLVLFFTLCIPVGAATFEAPLPETSSLLLLQQISSANKTLYADLQSFTCDERVERFRGKLGTPDSRHIDTLTARVSFENGSEHYADVRQNDQPMGAFSEASGAWSEGEYGTLLRQTAELVSVFRPQAVEEGIWNGEPVSILSLQVEASDSPWQLVLERGEVRAIGFDTLISVSKDSGKIVRVVRRSKDLPKGTGISEIEWSISLKASNIRNSSWLVPDAGEYSVSYAGLNRRESNRIFFSNYRRYGAEASIRYGN